MESLTEEQRERIRKNRERALEIRRRKQREEEEDKNKNKKRKRQEEEKEDKNKQQKEDVILEDFEVGASPWVSKREAMQMYCLPEGTLAVCTVEERPNPRNGKWAAMKLYDREEIRRRARQRFGGLEGLQQERQRRAQKRLEKDLVRADSIFD